MPGGCCSSRRVSLLADFLAQRYGLQNALRVGGENADCLRHDADGQRAFDEQQPGFVGTYSGIASAPKPARPLKTRIPSSASARASPTPSPPDSPNTFRRKKR
jgi:hypothetical protein